MEPKYAVGGLNPVPGIIVSGKGSTLIDVDGKEIIDFICMFSAANLGHCTLSLSKPLSTRYLGGYIDHILRNGL
ncbi:unnamed protein product [Clonostachys chloroleuca]|uniref:Ornithine aminotransferase n=1 Tax=Clonostachys chloroleuca TaxID=1926264 RepID=A0AA35LZ67_9HYPO|nr:unnamed protein product [Clonostachys chloroleuca]